MKTKLVVGSIIAVVLLTLVSFSSVVSKVSLNEELAELDVEFCGLDKKHTVKLTKEEYNEVRLIFDDMQDRLSKIENDEGVVAIFNKAIVELNEYGLLGGLSVKQTQRLITTRYQIFRENKFFHRMLNLGKSDDGANYFCLVLGNLTETIYQNPLSRLLSISYYKIMDTNISGVLKIIICTMTNFQYPYISLSYLLPFSFFSTITAGHVHQGTYGDYINASKGVVYSFGLSGNKSWTGELWGAASEIPSYIFVDAFYPAIPGFTGIKLYTKSSETYFLGFGFKANFTSECPYPYRSTI